MRDKKPSKSESRTQAETSLTLAVATSTKHVAGDNRNKNKNWDFIKIKSFCAVKETISKTKRQPTEWVKIFANDISDKGLVSKIYK